MTICKEGKNEYLIIADSGEFKVWGISDIDVLSHYLNDSAEDFDPQYRCVYEDQKSAFSSDYAPFFRYAENILTGFAITTGE